MYEIGSADIFILLLLLLLEVTIFGIDIVNNQKTIIMNQKELAEALQKVSDQVQKGITEVIAAVQAAGNTTPEVDAALLKLQEAAQALDDLNPDTPTP